MKSNIKGSIALAVWLTPAVAFAGGGGAQTDVGAFLIQALSALVGKIAGMF